MQQNSVLNTELLDATARFLIGDLNNTDAPRNILAIGIRAVPTDGTTDMSKIVLDLAEALDAPVLTRLHAKGVVDETHPLSFGVIGVHGKPGLQSAAALISTSDCVVSIGVEDETLLACNMAGLQIRKVVEIEPDAMCVNTRFNAEYTMVGNIAMTLRDLTKRVLELRRARRGHSPPRHIDSKTRNEEMTEEQVNSMWDYMEYGAQTSMEKLDESDRQDNKDLVDDTDTLWDQIHSKKVCLFCNGR